MTKPVGIRIIAIGTFVAAAFGAIMGTRVVLPLIYQLVKTPNNRASDGMAELAAAAILLVIALILVNVLAAWGLWKLKNWARVLTIVLYGLSAAFELLRWLLAHHLDTSYFISIGLSAVIIFYLLKPGVVSAFSSS